VYLGPQSQLQPYYDLRRFLNVQFVYGVMVAVLVLGAIMLGVWSGRRTERVYLWYAITSVTFLVYCLCLASSGLSLPSLWWDWLLQVSRTWMIAAITVFGIHFLGLSRPRVVTFLGWYSLVGSLALAVLALVSPERFSFVSIGPWNLAGIVFCLYPVALFVRQLWRRTDAASFWMLASASSLILGGAHDVLMENGLFAPFDGHYYPFMVPLAITTFTWILIGRFLRALAEAETLNRELNQRVLQKQAELERTYEELKRSERQRTLADERERIQRDMHDGLGGTLVSTLAGLELQGEQDSSAAQSLRGALDDLRLMIYSLDPASDTLRAALGTLRERLGRLAEEAGLTLEWSVQGLPAELALERGVTLQVMRIVQEAFTNTVKHAQAQTFSLRVSEQTHNSRAGVQLEMRDDGRGFEPAGIKSGGYGLSNMRVRAQKIGGQFEIAPALPGTRITLWVQVG
jgi:signal transduction histidine kinase